jgi:hypothetical protein
VVRELPVSVTGAGVSVVFQSVLNDAVVSALELVPATGPTLPPPTPGHLQALAGDGRVDLNWTPSQGATHYSVRRSLAAGGPYTVIAADVTAAEFSDTGLSNGIAHYYTVSASGPGGASAPSGAVVATPRAAVPVIEPLRINCGGLGFTDQAGVPWLGDRYAVGGAPFTYSPRDIAGTGDDYRYYTVRYSNGANFAYSLPAAAGSYTLKLHFAECWFTTPGNRVFNVRVNGALALANLDVVAAAGANSAVTRIIPVTVTNTGGVSVLLENVRNGPIISAIELIPES